MSNLAAPFYTSQTGKRVIYYHTSWSNYGRNYQVKDLPIDKITDIAYAFFNIDSSGKVFSGDTWADFENPYIGKGVEPQNTWSSPPSDLGNFGQFNKLLKQGKKFNVALSIGGWSWSGKFSDAFATDTGRQNAVNSILTLFQKCPALFNGINIDWEYLSNDGKNYGMDGNIARPEDPNNFIEFLKLLKQTFGNNFRISLAVTGAPEKIKIPVDKLLPFIDEWHVMTYDMHDGSWGEKVSGHHTNLRPSPYGIYSVEEATAAWLGYGVPANKLFIGAAFYSRGFANTDGIGKPCSGGSPDKSWENGVVDYKALPLSGAVEMWDATAHAGYSYDSSRKVLNSYDTVQSVKEKCQFVYENDLGGIIVWESSGDQPFTNQRSLMKVLSENLTHGKPTDVKPSPKVNPTKPGDKFVPVVVGGGSTSEPVSPPKPPPSTKTYSCDFCTICTKTTNNPCVRRSTVNPSGPSPTTDNLWIVGKSYKTGDVVTYNGKQYRCLMNHTSIESWNPGLAGFLWNHV